MNLFQECDKLLFGSTFQQSSFFLATRKICVSSPGRINVFQSNRECFFFRRKEFNSRFIVMTIDEVTLNRPKSLSGLQRHLLILSDEDLPVRLEVLH